MASVDNVTLEKALCPVCGKPPRADVVFTFTGFYVACSTRGCIGGPRRSTARGAVKAWNKRMEGAGKCS